MQQREKGKGKKQTHFKINFPFVDFDERKFFQPELNLKKKRFDEENEKQEEQIFLKSK